jgi:hypothetical protein
VQSSSAVEPDKGGEARSEELGSENYFIQLEEYDSSRNGLAGQKMHLDPDAATLGTISVAS